MENHIQIRGIPSRIQYIANGENTSFEFPFAIFNDNNLQVYLNDILQNSNTYIVSGTGSDEGGSVLFSSAPAEGTIVTLIRKLNIERTTDFQEGGTLHANALNYELDYQIACQQQIAENLNRSMVLPPYATSGDVDLTLPLPSAGKAIVWNSDGTNLENSTVEVNALESTLNGYKTAAESAAETATTKAGIASDKADIATTKAQLASDKADIATEKAAEAASTLASKANKDMDNLSTDGKAAVARLSMPDYSAGVSKSWNTSIQADKDGWVKVYGGGNAEDSSYVLEISTDGSTWTRVASMYAYSSNTTGAVLIPMPKGTYYKASQGPVTSARVLTFYPCKGA